MKATSSFSVRPRLPESLAPLEDLAMNLRWSWDKPTRELFRLIDPNVWEEHRHDPVAMLGSVSYDQLVAMESNADFVALLNETHSALKHALSHDRWFQKQGSSPLQKVAYFSPEFGIAEALPQYSGGLGVLAGDHLKAASDLGIPLVGVGLFYRHGYFRQSLNTDGWQQERYPALDPFLMAIRQVDDIRIEVDLAGTPLFARVWRADVGSVRLYLLDSDVDENRPEYRIVTDRLYGGDVEHRLKQEILLGIGGIRALEAVNEDPHIFHTNEGHAGFLGLERIRRLIQNHSLSFPEALEAVRAASIFTTHTPVPAGIDRFPRELIERYFTGFADACGIGFEDLWALGATPNHNGANHNGHSGHDDDENGDQDANEGDSNNEDHETFNMAFMGLRLASRSNGVSRLHGEVSRSMFAQLWGSVPEEEVPIGSITNGVHAATWVFPEMQDLLNRNLESGWGEDNYEQWSRLGEVANQELWQVREQGRMRLVELARSHLRASLEARGASHSDTHWCDEALDPEVLTICFARRFATYKRATLLLSQPERLRALLCSTDRPVQFIFAGKAHPADDLGKEMIRQIVMFSTDPEIRTRFIFLDDYDISLARVLFQGADVWLNNPRRPLEACGTSGMKAALNGGLNCSVLDGWWDECFNGENGWAISSIEDVENLGKRDHIEADSLFAILEQQVVPLFYQRDHNQVPNQWVEKIKSSLSSLGPFVTAGRMVQNYVEELYEPTAEHARVMSESNFEKARELAAWKQKVNQAWKEVHIDSVESQPAGELGQTAIVEAIVSIGEFSCSDISVQLIHGLVGQNDEMTEVITIPMSQVGSLDDGHMTYKGSFECTKAGRYGFTVRVIPNHPNIANPLEMGLVVWK